MNFKSMPVNVATLAAFSVAGAAAFAAPSQAAIVKGDVLDINGAPGSLVQVLGSGLNTNAANVTGLDFGANGAGTGSIQVVGGTGGFSSYLGNSGTIKDLSFTSGISGAVDNFLSINPDLFFDLKKATVTVGALAGTLRSVNVDFDGNFSNAAGTILGEGLLTTQLNLDGFNQDKASSYSITAEAVPTPALLPGLIGMGLAALRKRKGEVAERTEA